MLKSYLYKQGAEISFRIATKLELLIIHTPAWSSSIKSWSN